MTHFLTMALFGFASGPAHAAEVSDWAVGAKVGTNVIPGKMPWRLPKVARDDTDAAGDSAIAGVRGDVSLGLDAVYYIQRSSRLGLMGNLGLGGGFSDVAVLIHYDHAVATTDTIDFMVGGGIGAGSTRFRGADDALLKVRNFPLRGQVSGFFHQESFGVQLAAFAQWNIPSNQLYRPRFEVDDLDASGGIYGSIGIDLTVFVGSLDLL